MLQQNTLKRATRIQETFGDRVFLAGVYLFLLIVLVAVLYPLIYVISSSFSSPIAVSSGRVWLWPVDFSLRGYQVALGNPQIITGYANSLYYTFFGTLISVALTVLVAYPLSRRTLFGRNGVMKPNITDYVNQNALQFVTGAKSLDTDWDAYVAGLDQLNLKGYLEVMQASYDASFKK